MDNYSRHVRCYVSLTTLYINFQGFTLKEWPSLDWKKLQQSELKTWMAWPIDQTTFVASVISIFFTCISGMGKAANNTI